MDPAQKAASNNANNQQVTPSVPNNGTVPLQKPLAVPDQGKSSDQIRKLGEKIEQAPIPEDLRQMLLERISRLALLRSSAGFMSTNYILEYENTSTYINWVVRLPWGKNTQDVLDLIRAKQILDKNHYGLEIIKTRILEYMATVILNLKNKTLEHIAHTPILSLFGF